MIRNFINNSSLRSRRVFLGIFSGVLGRGFATLTGLITTPILIRGLGNDGFGLSIAIGGAIQWLTIANFGLSQGLQNSLIEAAAKNDPKELKKLVSTAFITLGFISMAMIAGWCLCSPFIPWNQLFPTNNMRFYQDIAPSVNVVFWGLLFQLLHGLMLSIFAARQDVHFGNISSMLSSVCGSVASATAVYQGHGLYVSTLSYVLTSIATCLLLYSYYFSKNKAQDYFPSIHFFSRNYLPDIFRKSSWFFVIQICWMALFQTDSFIILHCVKADEITPYNIAIRVFTLVSVIYSFMAQPLWAAYGNALATGNRDWIRTTHAKVRKYFVLTYFIIFPGILLLGPKFISLWVGKTATPSTLLLATCGLYVGIRNWSDIHAVVINALGIVRPQAFSAIVQTLFFIPVAIYLSTTLGAIGASLAGILAFLLVPAWYLPKLANEALELK